VEKWVFGGRITGQIRSYRMIYSIKRNPPKNWNLLVGNLRKNFIIPPSLYPYECPLPLEKGIEASNLLLLFGARIHRPLGRVIRRIIEFLNFMN
jgi:hypothetical protein